jgi:16S rRNA (uracil1498-N3)-methyltransferase
MELYYGQTSGDHTITLDEDESNHLIKVNRKNTGELVLVTDGEGSLFTTQLIEKTKRNCILEIKSVEKTQPRNQKLHIAIAPTKSIDRMEWFLEKATESGIDEITFLVCRHSERRELKEERLKRVLIAAMKQSLKTFLPKLNPLTDFKDFVNKEKEDVKLIFTTTASEEKNFKTNYQKNRPLTALIGPEGDFHESELELALQKGYIFTSLGHSRLRTETAGINVCMLFNFINSF